jgi:hypothetical protein
LGEFLALECDSGSNAWVIVINPIVFIARKTTDKKTYFWL